MASAFLKAATPVIQANGRFAAATIAWVVLETSVATLKERESAPDCESGSFWWFALIVGGMGIGVFGGLGDLFNDLNLRFREDHLCILGHQTAKGKWEPFESVREIANIDKSTLKVGELLYRETNWAESSKIYRVEEVNGSRFKEDYLPSPAATGVGYGSINTKTKQQVELDEQQRSLIDGKEQKDNFPEKLLDIEDNQFETVKVHRYVGTSGSFPTEFKADKICNVYNGAIVRTPNWLVVWALLRCTTSILFFNFFVYVTSIPVFDSSCLFGSRQLEGAYVGTALAGMFLSLVFKLCLPGLPAKGDCHRPYEMDGKIGWIWFPAYEEQLQPEVYNVRWQGFGKLTNLWWKIVFYVYLLVLCGTPVLSMYLWGAFDLLD